MTSIYVICSCGFRSFKPSAISRKRKKKLNDFVLKTYIFSSQKRGVAYTFSTLQPLFESNTDDQILEMKCVVSKVDMKVHVLNRLCKDRKADAGQSFRNILWVLNAGILILVKWANIVHDYDLALYK